MKRPLFHRLTAHLKLYFPGDRLVEIDSSLVADFLERWPSLEKLQKARPATIERFFIGHHSRNASASHNGWSRFRKQSRQQKTKPPAVLP